MNGGPQGGQASGHASVDLKLSMALELFGLRVDAAADVGPGIDTVLSLRLGDLTLGDLLRFLVDKAEPGRDVKLTPPWDFLNTINLHDFTFEVDLTRFRIGFRYDGIGFSTPFISLTAIELFYSSATADRPKSVDLSLFGSFLGVDFSKEPGLSWDVLSEPAPSVPGQGTKLFDLEYLAIGQHVTLRNTAQLGTIGAVIDALESTGRPADPHKNPLTQLPALKFDGGSGWLFATKFSALETVTLSAVFNDPVLYGLRVALDGKRVGKLAGLEFEILYRKISDSLGVFHTELKLPDAVRTIEAGEATITLPIIDVDVYTNGNFLVDLGFPRNLDFSRALSVDFLVFVPVPVPVSAAVGLYFGVLSGETSNQVPQVTNGRFDPVIVAGIGVRVGLGYALSLGPLQADFFAGIVGILEGVLAWFHPDTDPHSQAVYYRISGTVGIQIHIAGTVNLAILQASLDIEAYADAAAVVESYQPIHLTFEAGVSISLSVKVLFFHITLSFSATIRESITIGSASPTPWVLGAAQPGPPAPARAVRRGAPSQALFAELVRTGIAWHDQARLVSPVAPGNLTLEVYVQPMITAGRAGDRPGGTPSAAQPQLVVVLFVADGTDDAGSLSPFARLAREAFVWAAESADLSMRLTGASASAPVDPGPIDPGPIDSDTPISAAHLHALYADLVDPTRPFPVSRVVDFLTARGITLDLKPIPDPPPEAQAPSYTVFPMPPFVAMTVDGTVVDFGTGPYAAGPDYQSFVTRYFQDLSAGAAPSPDPAARSGAGSAAEPDSVAAVLFADYFAFLLRQLVQDALDLYRTYGYPAVGPDDTLDAIADRFGISDPELVTLNLDVPGLLVADQVLRFATGDIATTQARDTLRDLVDRSGHTAADVAAALGAQPGVLAPGAVLVLPGGTTHTVLAGETLLSIASGQAPVVSDDAAVIRIGRANQTSSTFFPTDTVLTINRLSTQVLGGETLRTLANRLQSTPLLVARAVRDRTAVLQVGAGLQIAGAHCTVAADETLDGIATRLATTTDVVVGAAADVPGLLRPLAVLTLPPGAYTVSPGDTLRGIAARTRLTLAQVGQEAATATGLLVAGVTFTLPTTSYTVVATTGSADAESLGSIVDRFGTTLADLVGANADTPALRPGAAVSFGLTTQVRSGESLRQLAGRFGLNDRQALAELVGALDDVPGLLTPGATLAVARPGTYTIADGDTLASLAAAFATTPQAVTAANPTVDCTEGHPCWYPPPTGLTIALPPGLTYPVQPTDVLAGIARRFGLSAVDLVLGPADPGDPADLGNAANLDNAGLLMPQTAIQLPDVAHVVAQGETPLGIAQNFGLTVDQLVLANRAARFGTVVVPDAQVLPLGVLVDELAAAGSFSKPAGALARFLLHGLRLPSPDDVPAATPPDGAALPLHPLYTLTGQQVTPPVPPPTDYAITLSAGTRTPRPTITFVDGDHVTVRLSSADRTTLDAIRTQLAQQPPIDAVPLAETPYPAVAVAPRQYALGRPIPWQAASPPPLTHDTGVGAPVPASGSPALYPFPDALRGQVATSAGLWVDQVAAAAEDVAGLLTPGYRLTLGPATHVVTGTDTLGSVTAALGTSLAELADAVADLTGLILPGVPLPLPGAGRLTRAGDTLRSLGAGAGPGLLVDLVTGVTTTPTAPVEQRPVTGFGWATRIDFGVRRVPDLGRPGQFRTTVFEVFGTDPAATDDLERLLSYLGGPGTGADVRLALLYPAGALAGAGPGLRSDPDGSTDVLLLKANLSTRSEPVPAAAAPAADPLLAAAPMTSDPRSFLTLLWEAAVTNTGGFFLLYSVAGPAPGGLPPEIFNQDPTATVSLVATVFPAAGSWSTVALQPFHNTAAVVEALPDPTATVLAVPRRYTTSGPVTSLQAVAAHLGVSAQALGAANVETRNLLAPNTTITVGAASRTVLPGDTLGSVARVLGASVPSLVAALAADTGALNPGAALEIHPAWLTHRGTLRPGTAGFRVVRTDPDPAVTRQDDAKTKLAVLFNLIAYRLTGDPAGGFAASPEGLPVGPTRSTSGPLNHALTAVSGTDTWTYQKQVRVDRYARGGSVTLGDLQDPYAGVGTRAQFGWQYQDVFGNRLLDPRTIDVDVRYTDELIGVSQWPALLTGYRFTDPPEPVSLAVTLDLDTSVYVAAPGEVFAPVGTTGTPAGLAARAAAHRDRYAQIFWQLSHDLAADVTTTVDGSTPHDVRVPDLAAFVATTWAYLQTVAGLTQATVVTGDGDTLASLAAAHHVTPAELAAANRSVAQNAHAAELLSSPEPGPVRSVVVEARYSVIRNDTLEHVAAQAPSFVQTDAGQVAAANADVALQAGRLLVVGTVHAVAAGETFSSLAAGNGLAPAQLGAANAERGGLLTPGTTLTLPRATAYRVVDGDTLASIATRSAVPVADVAVALAAAGGGPLVGGSALVVPVALTTVAGDTPAGLAQRFAVTPTELIGANATVDALLPGAQIALPTGGRYTVHPGDTLAAVAATAATDVAELAALNAGSPAVFRPGARLTSPYRVQAGDTFASVGDRFGVSPHALGAANARVAGLVAAEQSVLLATRTQPVEPGDTFASLAAATGVPIAALATANATTPGLLTRGVTVALPRHLRVPATAHTHTVAAGETWAGIAAAAAVDVALLGAANADVDGLLAPGVTLSFPVPGGRTYQVVTRPQETLSTVALAVAALLAADGVRQQPTAALVAEANQAVACLAVGGLMLVPPATFTFATPVTATNDLAIFPLEAAMTLRRTANVDPALADNPAVTAVSTPLAPLLPEGAAGRTVALREFAGTFEAAFTSPQLKLTTTGNIAAAGTPRFVAVQYGPGTAVDIELATAGGGSAPRFFAPRPVSARPGPGGDYQTSLWSSPGPIPITDYVRGTGPAPRARSMTFTGVDLDVWGRQFLAQLDLVLSAGYAVAAHRLSAEAYGMLLAAKRTLADAIRDSVAQVTAPGTASAAELAAARDLLHGRLLTTLSEAYLTDAIVTVPVVVTAPPAWSGANAPRVHGQPVGTTAAVPAARHTTAAGDTLATVAAAGSSLWAVGAANADLVGLLAAGAALTLPSGQAYHTTSGDTLASIADRHDLPLAAVVDAAAEVTGLLAPGVAVTVPTATLRSLAAVFSAPVALLVDLLADTSGILLPGAVVAGPRTATVAAGDTLATVAARFRRGVPELGAALGSVPGLLAAGVSILTSTGVTYTTRIADTLTGIASALAVPLAGLAADAAQVPDLLVPGVAIELPPYTVAVDDTLAGVAAHFPGTTADLGAALVDTPGVLQHGAGVNLVVRTYPLAEGDSLRTALAALALDVATREAAAGAAADLAAMNAEVPDLFATGTVLPVPEPVTVADGDTLVSLARAHHLTPSEVAAAIAARGDVLRPGAVLALPDPEIAPYTVGPGDTLDSIAAHIGHGVTPSWIVSAFLETPGILTAGTTVSYLSRVPGFSLSDATVPLADSHAAPTGSTPLAFLLHTASNIEFDTLAVDLAFPVNQLEYDITDVPWATGYQSADWLTFLRPPTATAIGQIDIPIALRTFPVPPSVVGQRTSTPTARTVVGAADTLRTVADAVGLPATAAADALLTPGALLELPTTDRLRARPGDTAADVADRLGVPPELVVAAARRHGVVDPTTTADGPLPTGAIVPVPRVHTVGPGESLAAVAERHGVPVAHLVARNADTPGLLQQGTAVVATASPTLQELRRYDYDVTFDVRRAAQDTVSTGYIQNMPPGPNGTTAAALVVDSTDSGGLGGSLAQFATVRQQLAGDLALIPAVDPLLPTATATTVNPAAAAALTTFAPLAVRIADDWARWVAPSSAAPTPPPPAGGAVPQHDLRFELQRGTSTAGEPTVRLLPQGPVAALLADEPVIGLAGHLAADGDARAGLAPVAFARDTPPLAGSDAVTVTSTVPDVDTYTLALPDRDVISTQNVWGRMSLTRNAALLPGMPTSSAFVYTVPDARMPAPATPLITSTDPFALTDVPFARPGTPPDTGSATPDRRPLADWLINFFDSLLNRYAVLDTDTLRKIATRYGVGLADLTPAVADIPGLLLAGTRLSLPGATYTCASTDTLRGIAATQSAALSDVVGAVADTRPALVPGTLLRPVAAARHLRVSVDFAFVVAAAADPGQSDEIISRLPVLLRPTSLFDSATDLDPASGFCSDLARELTAWATGRGLPDDVGMWLLGVGLHTTLPSTGSPAGSVPDTAPPLLQLENVRLPRDRVAPPAPQ